MTKHVIALIAGIVLGAGAAVALLFYNPLAMENSVSPVTVSDRKTISLEYSAVAKDSILYTNDGESRVYPYPEKVQKRLSTEPTCK